MERSCLPSLGFASRSSSLRAMNTPTDSTLRGAARAAVLGAFQRAVEAGTLIAPESPLTLDQVQVDRPANPEHGDLSTNLALRLAKPLRKSPMEIASAISAALQSDGPVARSAVAPPGFLNLWLSPAYLERALDAAVAAGGSFGRVATADARHINVEFVSANPTGPLTVGNARGAFVGDLLARLLEAAGNRVTREYYFNDAGRQVQLLGASVAARGLGEPIPEDGYRGDYVEDLAREMPVE